MLVDDCECGMKVLLKGEKFFLRVIAAELICAILAPTIILAASAELQFPSTRTPASMACKSLSRSLPNAGNREAALYCTSLRATEATEAQARFAVLGTVLVAITLIPTAVAAIYAAYQASLGRRSLLQEHRPWLHVENVELTSGLIFSHDQARFSFELTVRNVGRTPARGVFLMPELHIRFDIPAGQAQRKSAKAHDDRPLEWGTTIFPGQPHVFRHSIGVGRAEWEQYWAEFGEAFPGGHQLEFFSLALIGTVTYGSVLDRKVHHTGFAYDIRRTSFVDPDGNPSVAIGPKYGDIALNDLHMQLPWTDVLVD